MVSGHGIKVWYIKTGIQQPFMFWPWMSLFSRNMGHCTLLWPHKQTHVGGNTVDSSEPLPILVSTLIVFGTLNNNDYFLNLLTFEFKRIRMVLNAKPQSGNTCYFHYHAPTSWPLSHIEHLKTERGTQSIQTQDHFSSVSRVTGTTIALFWGFPSHFSPVMKVRGPLSILFFVYWKINNKKIESPKFSMFLQWIAQFTLH